MGKSKSFRFKLVYKGRTIEFFVQNNPGVSTVNIFRINQNNGKILGFFSIPYDEGYSVFGGRDMNIFDFLQILVKKNELNSNSADLIENSFNFPIRFSTYSLDEIKQIIDNSKTPVEVYNRIKFEFNVFNIKYAYNLACSKGLCSEKFDNLLQEANMFYYSLNKFTFQDFRKIIMQYWGTKDLSYILSRIVSLAERNEIENAKRTLIYIMEKKSQRPIMVPFIAGRKLAIDYLMAVFNPEVSPNVSRLYSLWASVYEYYTKDEKKRLQVDNYIRSYNKRVKESGREYFLETYSDYFMQPNGYLLPFIYRIPDTFLTVNGQKFAVVKDTVLAEPHKRGPFYLQIGEDNKVESVLYKKPKIEMEEEI